MNIAGVVIFYNPDDDTINRINTYRKLIKKLFIIDNSEKQNLVLTTSLKEDDNISYYFDGQNKGVAKGLNIAAHKAIEENYDWLLTMDQDSFFNENVFKEYIDCFSGFEKKDIVTQFGIDYNAKLIASDKCSYKYVNNLITSGSILNLNIFKILGDFDENLFIDFVDIEYCFRSIKNYFSLVKFTNIHMQHNIGKVTYHRSLKNFKMTPRNLHSPVRIYYMTRNCMYVHSLYKKELKKEIGLIFKIILYHIKNNLLYNKQRIKVAKYIFKGIADYKSGKFGKI